MKLVNKREMIDLRGRQALFQEKVGKKLSNLVGGYVSVGDLRLMLQHLNSYEAYLKFLSTLSFLCDSEAQDVELERVNGQETAGLAPADEVEETLTRR